MVTINMTIPDTCSECRLSVRHFGKLYCPYLDGMVGNEGKDERCPLVDAVGCYGCRYERKEEWLDKEAEGI